MMYVRHVAQKQKFISFKNFFACIIKLEFLLQFRVFNEFVAFLNEEISSPFLTLSSFYITKLLGRSMLLLLKCVGHIFIDACSNKHRSSFQYYDVLVTYESFIFDSDVSKT